jgi:hypothetical protein
MTAARLPSATYVVHAVGRPMDAETGTSPLTLVYPEYSRSIGGAPSGCT